MAKKTQIPNRKYKLNILLACLPIDVQSNILIEIVESGVTEWNLRKIRHSVTSEKWSANYSDLKIVVAVLMPYNKLFTSAIGISISSAEDIIVPDVKPVPNKKQKPRLQKL